MRKIGSTFMAAVLGSLLTVATFQWIEKDNDGEKVSYTSSVPMNRVAYAVDEEGKAVPLDFTVAAEKVMPAVVHIRSTYSGPAKPQYEIPEAFRDFFGPMVFIAPMANFFPGYASFVRYASIIHTPQP